MRGAALAGLACLLMGAGSAAGQYLQMDADQQGYPLSEARPSVRLTSMGQLALVIPDENNELNLSDFARNLAGMAADRDGWSLETWGVRTNHVADFLDRQAGVEVWQRSRYQEEFAGMDGVYRKGNRRAIGLTSGWNGHDVRVRYGPETRVRGPNVRAFYNEVLGDLSLAVGIRTWSDNEDLVSSDMFSIRHFSSTKSLTMASAYALGGWQVGGQVDLDQVSISGRSRDPAGFHQDEFEWTRPATQVRLSLLRPEGDGKLAAGFNLSMVRRDGNEEAHISWANRFPSNPSRVNFTAAVPTFEEKERIWVAEGRGLYQLSPALQVGASGEYRTRDWDVDEDPSQNFLGSAREQKTEVSGWRVGGGTGLTLRSDRLRVGAEGFFVRRTLSSRFPLDRVDRDSQSLELHLGGEWLLPSRLALRAGYVRGSYDDDLDLPFSLYVGNGVSLGVGYVPRGGLISLDAGLRVTRQEPDYSGGPRRKTDVQELAAAARFLF